MPVKKFNMGNVSATVWENETTKDNEKIKFFSVTIERRYMDKSENWQSTSAFNARDLPKVESCARLAYEYIMLRNGEDNKD